jgi:outer membrane translocation and assembly module TamA
MSIAGNEDMLRGYPKNRFRDNHFMGTQVEYRFPLFWRFGMTTFAGFGDVFSRPQDLSWRTTKYTVGAGLRFMVNSAERLNIRLDYGYGSQGGYFWFSVAEAF